MKSKKKLKKRHKKSQWFRAGAGAIITNKKGEVLLFERSDVPDSWQLPQGGIDSGEEPLAAVYREIEEETGIKKKHLSLITEEYCLLPYELPVPLRNKKTGRVQVHYWYLFQLIGEDKVIGLGDKKEFQNWQWIPLDKLTATTVSFRKPVYKALEGFISIHISER